MLAQRGVVCLCGCVCVCGVVGGVVGGRGGGGGGGAIFLRYNVHTYTYNLPYRCSIARYHRHRHTAGFWYLMYVKKKMRYHLTVSNSHRGR